LPRATTTSTSRSPLFSAFDVSDMQDVLTCIEDVADSYLTGWQNLPASG
jgi:hypothetical protein